MRLRTALGSFAIMVACLGSQAMADDCGPLKQLNTLDLVPGSNRALIPVSLNGVPKLFLLDTGGDFSQINAAVAQELQLPERETSMKLLDLSGHASSKYVRIEKFTVGRLTGPDIDLMESPNPDFGHGTRFVGIFAPDLMGRYDVEIDFGAHKMNYFSSDHCPGKVVYWPHKALAVQPFTFHKRHIHFIVKLDGKNVMAEIDTGSQNNSLRAEAAKRIFDLEPESPGNIPLNSQSMTTAFGRVFSSLDFDGVGVTNPRVIIIPDLVGSKDPNNGFKTGSRVQKVDDLDDQPDMLIGMDILRKLHLYIAFDENKLYITEASAPAPVQPQTAPAQ